MSGRLLVLGAGGQLARALAEAGPAAGYETMCAGRERADLGRRGAVSRLIDDIRPDIVINAAAYTQVDRAEAEPELARAVNADGAGEAAESARRAGARFVHVSTDYVFTDAGPHDEDSPVKPVNTYGATKRAGELAVTAADPDAAVVRAAGLFSGRGADFPSAMWRLAHGPGEIRVVDDQRVTPVHVDALAERLLRLAAVREASGLFHCAAAPGASWFEVAVEALRLLAESGGPERHAQPVDSTVFKRPAPRPSDSRLIGDRLEAATGLPAPQWRPWLAPALARWRQDRA